MTTGESIANGRLSNRLVLLALLLCGFYASYRAVHLALVNDEVGLVDSARQNSYVNLLRGSDKDSNLQFLATFLAKPCITFLPLNEITAARIPALLGLALFLWGVWRIGLEFPTGTTRVLITLALLSNAFLLDYFSLARGYALATGCAVLAMACLLRRDDDRLVCAVWLATATVLAQVGFAYFYAATVFVAVWLGRRKRIWAHSLASAASLGLFFGSRLLQVGTRAIFSIEMYQNYDGSGRDAGFVHGMVGSFVRAVFYDAPPAESWIRLLTLGLILVVGFVVLRAWWEPSEKVKTLSTLMVATLLVAGAAHFIAGVRYPEGRHALYFIPLTILMFGTMAAWSRQRWLRLVLWGLLLAWTGTGLEGVNLSHALGGRECADIPSALLALQEFHQQTGQDVMVAISGGKWQIWYYAEHLLGLHPDLRQRDLSYLRTYDWLTVYDWQVLQTFCGLPPDNPLMPGTTHVLLNLLDRGDEHLLATPPPGGFVQLHVYPASDTRLVRLIAPQHQGVMTLPSGQRYVGEFKRGWMNGRGTYTWPDGRKYDGEFKDDEPNGRGMYTWPDGRSYVGEFRDGRPEGTGRLTYPNGRVEDGVWKQGQFTAPTPN